MDATSFVADKAADATHVKAARKRLTEAGLAAKQVNAYLPEQVILVDEKLTFEAERDEVTKAILLPHPEMEKALVGVKPKKGDEGLFLSLAPATLKVKLAHTRLAQRLALLRVVEALRLHAAGNDGFPAKLDDITVPLPNDPVTGRPFEYKLEGGKAHVKGTPARGQEKVATFNVRYELSPRK